MSARPAWKQHAAKDVSRAETPQQCRQLLRLHLHNMNSRDLEESGAWGARAVLTRLRSAAQLEAAMKDVLGGLPAATPHGATLRLELAAFCVEGFGYRPLAGCLSYVMKQVAKHCGAGKLESTGEALVALAGAVSAAVLCHLSNGDGGEGEDDGGDPDAGAGVAGLAASAAWLPGLLAEPLLRALSSGPHAKRMAQAAAALGAVLTAAEAAERMPAVVALAQRCLAALLSMGQQCAEAFRPLTQSLAILGPHRIAASSLRHATSLCLKAGSHKDWHVRLAAVGALRAVAEQLCPTQAAIVAGGDTELHAGAAVALVLQQQRRRALQVLGDLKYDKIAGVRKAAKDALPAWKAIPPAKEEGTNGVAMLRGKENADPSAGACSSGARAPAVRKSAAHRTTRATDAAAPPAVPAQRPVWRPATVVPSPERDHRRVPSDVEQPRSGFVRPHLPPEQRDFGIVIKEGPRPAAKLPLAANVGEYSPPVEMPEGPYHHGVGSFGHAHVADAPAAERRPAEVAVTAPPASWAAEPERQPAVDVSATDAQPMPPPSAPSARQGAAGESVTLHRVCAWVDGVTVAAGQTVDMGVRITAPSSTSLPTPPSPTRISAPNSIVPVVTITASHANPPGAGAARERSDASRGDAQPFDIRGPSRRRWAPPPPPAAANYTIEQEPSRSSHVEFIDTSGLGDDGVWVSEGYAASHRSEVATPESSDPAQPSAETATSSPQPVHEQRSDPYSTGVERRGDTSSSATMRPSFRGADDRASSLASPVLSVVEIDSEAEDESHGGDTGEVESLGASLHDGAAADRDAQEGFGLQGAFVAGLSGRLLASQRGQLSRPLAEQPLPADHTAIGSAQTGSNFNWREHAAETPDAMDHLLSVERDARRSFLETVEQAEAAAAAVLSYTASPATRSRLAFAQAVDAADVAYHALDDSTNMQHGTPTGAGSPLSPEPVLSFAEAVAAADDAYATMHRRYSPEPSSPMAAGAASPVAAREPPTSPLSPRSSATVLGALQETVERSQLRPQSSAVWQPSPASLSLNDAAARRHMPPPDDDADYGGASAHWPSGDEFSTPPSRLAHLLGFSEAEQTPEGSSTEAPPASDSPLGDAETRVRRMRQHMADAIVDLSHARVPSPPLSPSRSPLAAAQGRGSPQANDWDTTRRWESCPPRSQSPLRDRRDQLIAAAGVEGPLGGRALQEALQRILRMQTEAIKAQYRTAHLEQMREIRDHAALSATERAEQEALVLRATETALQADIQEFIDELLPRLAAKLVGEPHYGRR